MMKASQLLKTCHQDICSTEVNAKVKSEITERRKMALEQNKALRAGGEANLFAFKVVHLLSVPAEQSLQVYEPEHR